MWSKSYLNFLSGLLFLSWAACKNKTSSTADSNTENTNARGRRFTLGGKTFTVSDSLVSESLIFNETKNQCYYRLINDTLYFSNVYSNLKDVVEEYSIYKIHTADIDTVLSEGKSRKITEGDKSGKMEALFTILPAKPEKLFFTRYDNEGNESNDFEEDLTMRFADTALAKKAAASLRITYWKD